MPACLSPCQVDGFLGGERDYSQLRGDTGPLVYPAGFLYAFTVLKWVTGGEVLSGQVSREGGRDDGGGFQNAWKRDRSSVVSRFERVLHKQHT